MGIKRRTEARLNEIIAETCPQLIHLPLSQLVAEHPGVPLFKSGRFDR